MAEIATLPPAKTLEKLLIDGDLSGLNAQERIDYVLKVCESLGLNPLTKPFAYIKLNGKLVLYALRDCSEQLRKIHGISVSGMHFETVGDVYVVRADFTTPDGRTDQATGAVPIKGLSGEALANAFMKAETKCKRRGTLSICGMGMLDETEVQSVQEIEAAADKKFPRLRGAKAEVRTMAELDTPSVGEEPADVVGSGEAAGPVVEDVGESGPGRAGRPDFGRIVTEAKVRHLEAAIRELAKALDVPPD